MICRDLLGSDAYLFGNQRNSNAFSTQRTSVSTHRLLFTPKPIAIRSKEALGKREIGSEVADIMSVYSVPWSVEVWAISPGGQKTRVHVDAYVDSSNNLNQTTNINAQGNQNQT